MHKILANTSFLGKEVIYMPECHSTNDVASIKFKNKEISEGAIVITDRQTRGRGQRGNSWHSEDGTNLTFSLVLTPRFLAVMDQFDLNMAIALGIKDALHAYSKRIMVKWPNDIVHESGDKIGGILIENTIGHKGMESSIIGIGLNINQTKFAFSRATSMTLLSGVSLDKDTIVESIALNIERYYLLLKNRKKQQIKDRYLSNLYRSGHLAAYNDGEDFVGKIIGVGDQGHLIIQKESGSIHHYAFKEVRFV